MIEWCLQLYNKQRSRLPPCFGEQCASCGFNRAEACRRNALPLICGKDGLKRKYVGILKPSGVMVND